MKKRALFLLTFTILVGQVSAQTFEWVAGSGGTSNDESKAITTDASGNIYITGIFRGTADFDPGPGTSELTSNGDQDIFIQKLNASGELIWVKSIGGDDIDEGKGITTDDAGNIYVTGSFSTTVDFDPNVGVTSLTSFGQRDIFVQKLSADGELIWVKQMGGNFLDGGDAIRLDDAGNIFVLGFFSGTADFLPGAGTHELMSNGNTDIAITKFDADGAHVWSRSVGGGNYDGGLGIDIDADGNCYVTGYFSWSVDFDPGAGTTTIISNGGNDLFVLKLDSDGDYVWAYGAGGTENEAGQGIVVDGSGDIVLTGYYEGTVDFDPGAGTTSLTAVGNTDSFVQKVDADGNLIWVQNIGGESWEYTYGIAADASNNIYTTGAFSGTTDFDPGAGTVNLTPVGDYDAFVQKLTPDGEFDLAYSVGGSAGELPFAITVDGSSNIYSTGFYTETAEFDTDGSTELTSAGARDFYVHKMSQEIDDVSLNAIENIRFSIYPNPSTDVFTITSDFSIHAVTITDLSGKIVLQGQGTTLSVENLTKGIYIVHVETNFGTAQRRLIKL